MEVAYWGDTVLVPHLINLLSKRSIKARLSFAHSREPMPDRKQEVRVLRQEVSSLHQSIFS